MEQVQKKKSSFSSEHILQLECIAWFRNSYERFGAGCIIPVPNELARKRKDIVIKDSLVNVIYTIKLNNFEENLKRSDSLLKESQKLRNSILKMKK